MNGVVTAKRVGRGLMALGAGFVVNTLGQIITVPLALWAWGTTRYGEWILLSGLVTLLRTTDLGIQTYVVNCLCQAFVRDERAHFNIIINSAIKIQCIIIITLFLIVCLLALGLPIANILAMTSVSDNVVRWAFVLLAADLLLSVPLGVVGGVYRATKRLPRAAVISAAQQLATLVISLCLIGLHRGFEDVAAARLAVTILTGIYLLIDLKRIHPWLNISTTAGHLRNGVQMVLPGLLFLLIPLADFVGQQCLLLVISSRSGGDEVSHFATHRTMVNIAQLVSGTFMAALWCEMTSLHSAGSALQLQRLNRLAVRCNLAVVSVIILSIVILSGPIYSRWTGGRLELSVSTLVLLGVRTILWAMWSTSQTLLMATNRQKPVGLTLLSSAVVSNIVAYTCLPLLGISGAAVGCLAGDVLCAWVMPKVAANQTGQPLTIMTRETLRSLGVSTVGAILMGVAANSAAFGINALRSIIATLILAVVLVVAWGGMHESEKAIVLQLANAARQKALLMLKGNLSDG